MRLQYRFGTENGFTLIELIVVLAVAAVLIGIAAPNLIDVVRNNRLSSQVNDLVTSLNLARSEALTRGQMITVCRSKNGGSCDADDGNWEDGWLVFSDSDGNGVIDAGESIIRRYPPLSAGTTLRSGVNFAKYLTYLETGASRGSTYIGSDSFRLCDFRGSAYAYEISVNATGRVDTSRTTTSCP